MNASGWDLGLQPPYLVPILGRVQQAEKAQIMRCEEIGAGTGWHIGFYHREFLGRRFSDFFFRSFIWFRFDLSCCYESCLGRFCSYDADAVSDMIFDMVSAMIRHASQNCVLKPTFEKIYIKILSNPNHRRISKASEPYQQRIETMSKSKQHSKTHQALTKNKSLGFFCFFVRKPTYRNHIKISKPYQNHKRPVSK